MYCKQCGKEMPEGAPFCTECGASADGTASGAMSAADAKFTSGWSWGGFFAPWIFMFVHKQKKLGWLLLLPVVAVWFISISTLVGFLPKSAAILALSFIIGLGRLAISIWIGIRGRSMVWSKGVYASVADMKKRRSLGTKLTIVYCILDILAITFVVVLGFAKMATLSQNLGAQVVSPSSSSSSPALNPTLADTIRQQALLDAKSKDPALVDADFNLGYDAGSMYGGDASSTPVSVRNQSESFQTGYGYGFGISCMIKYNDKNACTTRAIQALQIR